MEGDVQVVTLCLRHTSALRAGTETGQQHLAEAETSTDNLE